MKRLTLILVLSAMFTAPKAFASGGVERCSSDLMSASAELPLRDEWRDDPVAMKVEAGFMQTATLLEMESRSWQHLTKRQEGVYTIKGFQGRGYSSPPTMSEPFVSEHNGMWCVYINHTRLRNRVELTLDIGGNIVERNISKVIG